MKIQFHKYHGTGNDFILIDNREGNIKLTAKEIRHLCHRRFGIGADGLMLLNNHANYDFEMMYYNSDGLEGSMCGNGGRCITKFAYDLGLHKSNYTFIAADGEHECNLDLDGAIRLKMQNVSSIEESRGAFIVNTGSPHYVKQTQDVRHHKVKEEGHEIRWSKDFEKQGINVNFVEELDDKTIYVRTYERGVEDETLSCGTGVTASALIFAHNDFGFNRVEVQTPGGRLAVEFDKEGEELFKNIWLCGPAEFVFKGEVEI
ncbi:MAG TPA: diaminopimelate epimerase [Chitinophagaceae bacterium]|nr:diaminopimelate epimerase [Chitinophagaceae bacterium]